MSSLSDQIKSKRRTTTVQWRGIEIRLQEPSLESFKAFLKRKGSLQDDGDGVAGLESTLSLVKICLVEEIDEEALAMISSIENGDRSPVVKAVMDLTGITEEDDEGPIAEVPS